MSAGISRKNRLQMFAEGEFMLTLGEQTKALIGQYREGSQLDPGLIARARARALQADIKSS
jgi:hypothetical protein